MTGLALVAWHSQPEGARLVQTKCMGCHWNAPIGSVQYDRGGWEITVRRMEDAHGMEISDEERESILGWLSADRSPR